MPATDTHDQLMALLKRRGFLQPSYGIYGGVAGFFEYGPLGAELKNNLEALWRDVFVVGEGMLEVQTPTVSPEIVFRASGHLEKFADTVVECPHCGTGNRGDHLIEGEWQRMEDDAADVLKKVGGESLVAEVATRAAAIRASAGEDPGPENVRRLLTDVEEWRGEEGNVTVRLSASGILVTKGEKVSLDVTVRCPACSNALDVAKAHIGAFNLMFRTTIGPGSGRTGYLRPETAQGIFMAFPWLYRQNRESLPFGGVQLGKAYRNEISPRQSLLRLREFHQMEAEVFFDPEAKEWPGWDDVRDRELTLLARENDEPVRMRAGDAVAKGVVANAAVGHFLVLTRDYLVAAGLKEEKLRFRQHGATEMAHYSSDTWDAEFLSPRFGWVEIVGIADRTDYDLRAHERVSGEPLRAFRAYDEPREEEVLRVVPNPGKLGPEFKGKAGPIMDAMKAMTPEAEDLQEVTVTVDGESVTLGRDYFTVQRVRETVTGESFVPHVVEPSFGVDRILYAVLESAFDDASREWAMLKLPPRVAPVPVAVYPLMAKDGLDDAAQDLHRTLRRAGFVALYDEGGSIGKRYARADEVGIPWCVTVDHQTLDDGTVTVRDRETAEQTRLPRDEVAAWVRARR